MISRTTRVQLVAFVVIALLGVVYLAVRYIGVLNYVGATGYTVNVELPQAGGLFTNAEVTYRGSPVGRVGPMRLTATGIQVELDITSGGQIPSDVQAVVADRSVIGEQYLDLRPRTDSGPYLGNGSTIAERDTVLPPPIGTVLLTGDQLARSVPLPQLQRLIAELYTATQGAGADIRTLINSSKQFFSVASDSLPQTIDLIGTSQTVLATQQKESGAIQTFAKNLRLIGAQLRKSDGDISTVLKNGSGAASTAGGLVNDISGSAGQLLSSLLVTSNVFLAQNPGLRTLFVQLPNAISIGNSVVTRRGLNVGIVPTFFNPLPCNTGFFGTRVRTALDTGGNPGLNTKAVCRLSPSTGVNVRGGQNAP